MDNIQNTDNTDVGFLTVNVRYANGASPIGNSRIVLSKNGVVLYEYLTDLSGKTEPIPLDVGDDYSIKAFASGFVEAEYEAIPIVKDILTLQNVNMFPIPPAMKEAYNEQ
ncbi:MAG: hypothetical protein IKU48_03715 [Clostridia bacterium]|nr:hypothetical protein [Clostridia bacterium]